MGLKNKTQETASAILKPFVKNAIIDSELQVGGNLTIGDTYITIQAGEATYCQLEEIINKIISDFSKTQFSKTIEFKKTLQDNKTIKILAHEVVSEEINEKLEISDEHIKKINEKFIKKIEDYLIMKGQYQLSSDNPSPKILTYYYLEGFYDKIHQITNSLEELEPDFGRSFRKKLNALLRQERLLLDIFIDLSINSKNQDSDLYLYASEIRTHLERTKDLMIAELNRKHSLHVNVLIKNNILNGIIHKNTFFVIELRKAKEIAHKYSLN